MSRKFRKSLPLLLLLVAWGALFTGCGYSINYSNSQNKNFLDREDAIEFKVKKSKVEPITTIDIGTSLGDVELFEADDYYVEIDYLYWKEKPIYSITDGNLIFDDSPCLPNSYSVNFNLQNKIKVYLPEGANLEDITIHTSIGDVTIAGFIAEKLDISVSYGDLTMKQAAATEAEISLSSGSSKISDFQTSNLEFSNSYGDSTFTNINTGEKLFLTDMNYEDVNISMSSGKLKITNLKISNVDISNSYGDVILDKVIADKLRSSLSSGNLDISEADLKKIDLDNSYGDVTLELIGSDTDYSLDLNTSYGEIRIGNNKYEDHYDTNYEGPRKINADLSNGDIRIRFLG